MDRKQIFPGQIPLETDLLGTNKNVMIALGKLSAAVFGTASYVNGLTTGPNSPAALNVVVQPGELYSLQNIDGTAYSSIAADTTHQIVKQGVLLDTTTLSTPAPATGGFSINYLIQAAFSEIDTDAVVLPYYNASNPTQAYSGPANAGTTNNTTRKDTIILSAKAGIAATTGTQTTPAADAGYIGLYVVTVANGQTTVTAPNIVQLATAPIIPAGIIPAIQSGVYGYAADTGTANVYQATYSPAITALTDGMVLKFKAAHANTGASTFSPNGLAAQPIWGGDHAALTGGEIAPNGEVWAQWNTSLNGTGAWVLIDSTNGYIKSPTPPAGDNSAKLAPTAYAQNAVNGMSSVTVTTADVTLTAAQYGVGIINVTGALTGNRNIILPAQSGRWIIINGTTGNFTLTAKTAAGTGQLISQNTAQTVYGDGTNINGTSQNVKSVAGITAVCGSGSITLGNNSLRESRIGDTVFFTGTIDVVSVASASGTLTLTGLTNTCGNSTPNQAAVALRVSGGTNSIAGNIWEAYIPKNTNGIVISYYDPSTGTEGSNASAQCKAGTQFTLSGHYMVN